MKKYASGEDNNNNNNTNNTYGHSGMNHAGIHSPTTIHSPKHEFDNIPHLDEEEVEIEEASTLYNLEDTSGQKRHYHQDDFYHIGTTNTNTIPKISSNESNASGDHTKVNFVNNNNNNMDSNNKNNYNSLQRNFSTDSLASFVSSTELDSLSVLGDDEIREYVAEQLMPRSETSENLFEEITGHGFHSSYYQSNKANQHGGLGHHHSHIEHPIPEQSAHHQGHHLVNKMTGFGNVARRVMQKDQPVLLPSQKRKLRGWFMRKYAKARKRHMLDEEEEEEEENTNNNNKTKNWREKYLSCFFSKGESSSKVFYTELTQEERLKVHSLIIDLGYALALYGISANRVEYHLTVVAAYFGVDAYFNITPVGIWVSFSHARLKESDNRTYYIKVETQMLNLDKLAKLDNVAFNIAKGRLTIDEARRKIGEIVKAPNVYDHPVINLFMHFVCPGLFGLLWSGNLAELLTCLVSGFAIGVIHLIFQRFAFFRNVNQIFATIVAGLIGIFMKYIFWGSYEVSVALIVLAATWQFLPGQPMAVACYEVAAGSLLSGILRFVASFVVILKLGFGFLITNVIVTNIPGLGDNEKTAPDRDPIPLWMRFLVMIGLALNIVFTRRVPKNAFSIIFITLATVSAHMIAFVIADKLNNLEAGTVIGGIVIGILANIFSLLSQQPPIMVSGIGALLLGPGSMSFRGMAAFVFGDAVTGIAFTFEVILVGLALFLGYTIANIVVPTPTVTV
ncbi:hypothetical protein ABK040_015289 [Willaertia magna]